MINIRKKLFLFPHFILLLLLMFCFVNCDMPDSSIEIDSTNRAISYCNEKINDIELVDLKTLGKIVEEVAEKNPYMETEDVLIQTIDELVEIKKSSDPRTHRSDGVDSTFIVFGLKLTTCEVSEIFWLILEKGIFVPTMLGNLQDMAKAETYKTWNYADNSPANAFLHSYWNVLMSKTWGTGWAKRLADAHECNSPSLNSYMDYHNNEVGRKVFSDNPYLTESGYSNILMNYYYRRCGIKNGEAENNESSTGSNDGSVVGGGIIPIAIDSSQSDMENMDVTKSKECIDSTGLNSLVYLIVNNNIEVDKVKTKQGAELFRESPGNQYSPAIKSVTITPQHLIHYNRDTKSTTNVTELHLVGRGHNQDRVGYARVMRIDINGIIYMPITWLSQGQTKYFHTILSPNCLILGENIIKAYIAYSDDYYDNGHWVDLDLFFSK